MFHRLSTIGLPTIGLATAMVFSVVGCSEPVAIEPKPQVANPREAQLEAEIAPVIAVTESEEFITERSGQMLQLAQWLQGSFEPGPTMLPDVFGASLDYQGLVDFDLASLTVELLNGQPFASRDMQLSAESTRIDDPGFRPWPQITDHFDFDSCQFGTTGSETVSETRYRIETIFEGRFQDDQNRPIGIHARQDLVWEQDPDGRWLITGWIQKSFHVSVSAKSLFRDVTESAIPDAKTLEQVRNYTHWDLMVKNANQDTPKIRNTRAQYKAFNDWESAYQYPCVSVLDWNNDGLEDLFLTDRWGPAKLLQNEGDGTFRDVTADSGLTVEGLTTCAIFADFDNDGDQDAFLGGSLGPSRFFIRDEDGFVEDKSLATTLSHVKFVVSGSVADINGDGLLDLYLNTYGLGSGPLENWINDVVRWEDQAKLRQRLHQSHHFLDRTGLPNVVLMNHRGKLQRPKDIGHVLEQWHFSYMSTWSDFDSDGDPDLYICNDFAPDSMLRNDTPEGSLQPEFVDVSNEMIPGGQLGFGMGASWGDYNNDGQLDLYVSNMYSKAGSRILKRFPEAHQRIKTAASGNFLLEKRGDTFEQVAGFDAEDQHVSKVGWSFGGQFADFDNDSHLDLYVPSGFYTPPPQLVKPGDW